MAERHVIVVGQGAAGLSAALAAAEAAREAGVAARVTVVDRAGEADAGGNSRWSPSNIRMQSVDAMEPTFVDQVMAESGGRADRAYFQRLADEAPAMARRMARLGVEFQSPPYYLAKGPARIQPVGGGAALLGALRDAAAAAGADLLHECALRSLVVEDGRVAGIDCEGAGGTLRGDAVVLACGGFEGSAAMMREQFGDAAPSMRPISPGTPFDDGAGIRAALAAGARRAGDWNGMHAEPVDARCKGSAPVVLVYPYGIVVDRDGRRFFDEGAGLMHETWEAFARQIHFELPGRIAYAVLDRRVMDIPDWTRAIRSDVPAWRSDTIAGLAAQMGVPAAALERTVREYNAAATGDASTFDATRTDGLATAPGHAPRKSNWARRIEAPPFLAWPLVGAIAYTFGGIETDADARVIGARGPIPGLYAAGEVTGHFHGREPNAVSIMRALDFGRIAGHNAVRELPR